ncbi:MAG: phosphopantothenate/pantothenate synthetase [Spirochaetia bacterium]|nr:phosphopantothenate/pantothenate synthetase [Spirochaetia bacterium]
MDIHVPKDHPRYQSITIREMLVEMANASVVAPAGLIAHGRGEAFDYLFGEDTPPPAYEAIEASAASLLTAAHPVLSINGNAAALCPHQLVKLSEVSGAPLEINLFYRTLEREQAIAEVLYESGAQEVLGVGDDASETISEVGSERRRVDPRGIGRADVVFVPLEDGDRTEGLRGMGKTVLTVDLNPLSRTSRKANISIVDNLMRAVPLLTEAVERLKGRDERELKKIVNNFNNKRNLKACLDFIADRLYSFSFEGE